MLAKYAKYFFCSLSLLLLHKGLVNAAESDRVQQPT